MTSVDWNCVGVYLLALLAGLQINTSKSPGLLCPASEAVMNSEHSADWTSDPENGPLKRNECCYYVISVSVNKWNVECKKRQGLSVLLIFDSSERPQFSEGLKKRASFQNEISTIWKEKWHLFW